MKKRKAGILLVLVGAALLGAALLLLFYNQREDQAAGEASEEGLAQVQEAIRQAEAARTPAPETLPAEDGSTPAPTALPENMPEVMVDGYAYIGYVRIPSLELELPVLSDWDYEKLRIAPCRQFGSLYTEDLVIAAHNYDRHFGHLKELEPGAAASFTDMADGVCAGRDPHTGSQRPGIRRGREQQRPCHGAVYLHQGRAVPGGVFL